MIRVVLIGLAIYLIYKLVFDLIIPIYRTTSQVKRQFNDIKAKMEQDSQNFHNAQNSQNNTSSKPTPPKESVGEYIDFEEIK